MRVSRGATLILSIPQLVIETHCCLLTGATVGACRACSRVDFTYAGCCVALSRSSLLPDKRYLSRSLPSILLNTDYQGFCYLSIAIYIVQTLALLKATSVEFVLLSANTPILPEVNILLLTLSRYCLFM